HRLRLHALDRHRHGALHAAVRDVPRAHPGAGRSARPAAGHVRGRRRQHGRPRCHPPVVGRRRYMGGGQPTRMTPKLTETLARRAVERSVAERQAEYAQEMQRIVDATYGLIERTGSVDPPLRDVLRETGLSTQAFYRYFQSKDELLLLLLDDGRRRLLGYLEHRVQGAATPEAGLRAWVEGVLAQASQPRAAARTRPLLA